MAALGVALLMLLSPSIDRLSEATYSRGLGGANPAFEAMQSDTSKANDDTPVTADGDGGMNPNALPFAGSRHAMAYDSQSDRTLLFGGNTGVHRDATWAYDLNTNTWTDMSPSPTPSARSEHALAYDSQTDRVVLFGGWTGGGGDRSRETWAYDMDSNTWTNRNPAVEPSARYEHAMAYDSQSGRVILFGGHSGSIEDETWAYRLTTNTWANLNPAKRPSGRYGHAMAYDSQSDRVILFSGLGGQDETWAYDVNTNTWTNLNPAARPSPLAEHALAYDLESDRVVLFGGRILSTGEPGDETWAYDLNTNTWTNMSPTTRPSARSMHALVYDSESDRVVLFGGWTGSDSDETWAYDLNTNTWTNLTRATGPSAPRNLGATSGNAQVSLMWQLPASDGGSPITNYRVHRGLSPGGEAFLVQIGNVLTHMDLGLTNGVTYYYKVSAMNAVGEGSLSNEASATPRTIPSAPTGLAATLGNGQAILTWSAPVSDGGAPITNYRIHRGLSSGGEVFLVQIGNVLTHTDLGLTNGVTYYYEVSAVNAVGEGPLSNEASATPATFPTEPLNLQAFPASAQITLTWNSPASDGGLSISNYRVFRGLAPGTEVFLVKIGAVLTYLDGELLNGQEYCYTVTAVNAIGEGPPSSEACATPAAPPDTSRPTIAILSHADGATVTSRTVTVTGTSWDDVALEKVELSLDAVTWVLAAGATSWSGTLTLAEGANTIRARATDTSGNAATATVSVTVQLLSGPGEAPPPDIGVLVATLAIIAAVTIGAWLYFWRRKRARRGG